jgi:hypothetical protein
MLAAAEQESADFSALEEFDRGKQYEGHSDLGNIKLGDGT